MATLPPRVARRPAQKGHVTGFFSTTNSAFAGTRGVRHRTLKCHSARPVAHVTAARISRSSEPASSAKHDFILKTGTQVSDSRAPIGSEPIVRHEADDQTGCSDTIESYSRRPLPGTCFHPRQNSKRRAREQPRARLSLAVPTHSWRQRRLHPSARRRIPLWTWQHRFDCAYLSAGRWPASACGPRCIPEYASGEARQECRWQPSRARSIRSRDLRRLGGGRLPFTTHPHDDSQHLSKTSAATRITANGPLDELPLSIGVLLTDAVGGTSPTPRSAHRTGHRSGWRPGPGVLQSVPAWA